MSKTQKNRGLTLVEVILALAILGIILVSFLTMFTMAMTGVIGAGNKGLATSNVQFDLEGQIAKGETLWKDDLVVKFGLIEYSIRGGLAQATKSTGLQSSTIEAFIPLVPTALITPMTNAEGTLLPVTIKIDGDFTHFETAKTTVEIWNSENTLKLFDYIPVVVDQGDATFSLTNDLLSSHGDYIVKIITDRSASSEPNEIVRAKYTVQLPNLVAIADGELYTSANGEYWLNRSGVSHDPLPSTTGLISIIYGNDKYLAVGKDSVTNYVIRMPNLGAVTRNSLALIGDIKGLTYDASTKKYFLVLNQSNQGLIYSSINGLSWNLDQTLVDKQINGIYTTYDFKTYVYTAQGDIFVYDASESLSWQSPLVNVLANLKGMTKMNGGNPVFISDRLYINRLNSGNVGELITTIDEPFNSIASGDGLYVIASDAGVILSSKNLVDWIKQEPIFTHTSDDLNSVYFREKRFYVVGNSGVILRSSEVPDDLSIYNATTLTWSKYSGSMVTGSLLSITGQ